MDSTSKNATVKGYPTSSRLEWTPELNRRFVNAVAKLGIDDAVPKKILLLMQVKGLTRCHVASHLQKYRDVKKKLSRANHKVGTSSQPILLESSPTNNGASDQNKSSSMLDENQNNWTSYYNGMHGTNNHPILDTSHVLLPEPSFGPPHLGSLPNEGYSMQAMAYNLGEQRNIFDVAADLGVRSLVNPSYPGFVENCDDFINDHAIYSTEGHPYNNVRAGSSSDGVPHKDSTMDWNNEHPIINEKKIGEDDHLVWQEDEIAFLMSVVDDNGDHHKRTANTLSVTFKTPNQDLKAKNFQNSVSFDLNHKHQSSNGYVVDFDHKLNREVVILDSTNQDVNEQNFPNTVSFDSEEETRAINKHQTLDANLPGYDVSTQKFSEIVSFDSKRRRRPSNFRWISSWL